MLQDDASLVVPALVNKRNLIVLAVVEAPDARLLPDDQRMSGPHCSLVVQIATVAIAQIVAIEVGSRVRDRFGHHGVVVAVEEVHLLPAQVL